MKKTHLLKGMLAMTAAFIIALTGCPSPDGPKSTPIDPQKPVDSQPDSASGKYFSIKEDSKGLKVTLAEGVKIQKESGSHFWIEGIPFNMNITSEDIDSGRKEYIFPFVDKGKTYDFIFGAYISEDGGKTYNWKKETLKCKAGGGLDFNTIFNMNNAYESKLTVSFSAEEELFSGKLETPINSLSDFIKDKSVLESAKSDFQILLGQTEWKNSKYAAGTDVSFDYLSEDFSANLAKAKAGFDFIYPNREITPEDWIKLHYQYCGLFKTIFKLKEFSNTEFEIASLWSDQMRYTFVPHESTKNIVLNDYDDFSKIELEANHPWVDGKQDMTKVSNYEKNIDLTDVWGNDFPQKGDTVNISWSSIPNVDIKNVYCRLVENTAPVDWWKELCEVDFDNLEPYTLAKDLKANVPFESSISITLAENPIEGISLCMWYDVGDATPDGPAKFVSESVGTEAKGEYFSIKGTSEGIKITLADGLKIKKDGGNSISLLGNAKISITNENIENGKKTFIYPLTTKGETYTLKISFVDETTGARKEEQLECKAGGGIDYTKIINPMPLIDSSFDIEYFDNQPYYFGGKYNININSASEVILDPSMFKEAFVEFIAILGKTNWSNTTWWVSAKSLDLLEPVDEDKNSLSVAKNGFAYNNWGNKPTASDWAKHNYEYAGYATPVFYLKAYPDTRFELNGIYSTQKKVSVASQDDDPENITNPVPEDAVAIFNSYNLSGLSLPQNFTAPSYAYSAKIVENETYGKVLSFETSGEANYCSAKITFDEPIDLKDKTLYMVIKGKSEIDPSSYSDMKVLLLSGEEGVETYNFIPSDDTQFKTYSATNSSFWAAYEKEAISDWSKVDSLSFNLQMANYNFQIAAIYYK